jgi:hypothetical protein
LEKPKIELCHLADVLTEKETIFPAREISLVDLVAFSNSDITCSNPAFCARDAKPDSIDIGRLPRRTTLHGSHLFAACVGNAWIVETIPAYLQDKMASTPPDPPAELIPIEDECFIAARYGHGTWGHWLGEILPLAAVAERVYPGRFRYATTFYGGDNIAYGSRVVESFAAYGIAENRLFRMMRNRSYTFSSAYWMTPAWSDHILHPDVATVMRGAVHLDPIGAPRRIALLRRGARGRMLVNPEAIADLLHAYGYVSVDIESLSFREQISIFRNAKSVFSVLGSGLSGLLFSPDHVTVATVRPRQWQDRFFPALMQLRRGRWADISGPTSGDNPMGDPFAISKQDVASALQALHGNSTWNPDHGG